MGRKEDRKLKKLKGESLGRPSSPQELPLSPFILGDARIIPVHADMAQGTALRQDNALITPEEFMKTTHELSDKELNRLIYQNAKMAVEAGTNPPWPEDDSGTVMWFTWNFITPEMREAFPAIAKEYLENYKGEEGPASAHLNRKWEFTDIPYPRSNEATWEDAYFFRVLLMMLYAARAGSVYSRNVLISLYKLYYKSEYNKLKRLKNLTYLHVLEFHDEECLRKGLTSGHTTNGNLSFRDMVIEKRKHEPGWTDVFGDRALSPAPEKKRNRGDALDEAYNTLIDITDAPDEPPLQPAASRLFIMCELMGIEIDPTCNEQAVHMNMVNNQMTKILYLRSPEIRKLKGEVVERFRDMLRTVYPEMFDPFLYQRDEKYLPLELAELIVIDVFKKYDTNVRMLYDSHKFDLATLMAELTFNIQLEYPEMQHSFNTVLLLAMIQYLSECLCELMERRDTELDEVLRFGRHKNEGEWEREQKEQDRLSEKALRSVEGLKTPQNTDDEDAEESPTLDEESLREENRRLRELLSEKELQLAESEQKVILQRTLYERSHERELALSQQVEESSVEHSELIALREFVYGLKSKDEDESLDDDSREQIIDRIRDKKVTVLGGTERWIKRMKRFLPSWSFISVDEGMGSLLAIEGADIVYIYTSALKHKQYYKAMNIIRKGEKMLFFLKSSNTDECLRQFGRDLTRVE